MVWLSIRFIYLYRLIAPKKIRGSCRFDPTCSEFAILSLKKLGFIKGWKNAKARIKRCRPPHGGPDWP